MAAITAFACLLAVLTAGLAPAGAQGRFNEAEVKAAFLFNFAQFVTWPDQAFANDQAPLTIGVLGDDPFGRTLDDLVAGESVGGRRLTVSRFRRVEDVSAHILFIGREGPGEVDQILESLRGRPILTVGDSEGFAQRGGMIRFLNDRNRVRLRVNLEAVRSARLSISSSLLRAADIVTTEVRP